MQVARDGHKVPRKDAPALSDALDDLLKRPHTGGLVTVESPHAKQQRALGTAFHPTNESVHDSR